MRCIHYLHLIQTPPDQRCSPFSLSSFVSLYRGSLAGKEKTRVSKLKIKNKRLFSSCTPSEPLGFRFLFGDYPALNLLFYLLGKFAYAIAICTDKRDVNATLEEGIRAYPDTFREHALLERGKEGCDRRFRQTDGTGKTHGDAEMARLNHDGDDDDDIMS